MNFYTNVLQWGNQLFVREVKNGQRINSKVKYAPTLFSPVDQEMADYLAHRFLMMCGSDGECLRVGRELGDRRQTCRSNNNDAADTAAKITSGEYTVYDAGNGRIRVVDKDGNVVETIVSTSTGLEVTKRASKYDPINTKKPQKESKDLLQQFLHQQYTLLSTLLGRSDQVG